FSMSPVLTMVQLADSVTCDPNPPSYWSLHSDRALFTNVAEDPVENPKDSRHSAFASAVAGARSVRQGPALVTGLWGEFLDSQIPEALLSIWLPEPVDPLVGRANDRSAGFYGLTPTKKLGRGSYGTVYLVRVAEKKVADRAAKILKLHYEYTRPLLQREIRIHSILKTSHNGGCHPNIVRLDYVQEEPKVFTLVMDYCEGGNLEDYAKTLSLNVLTDAAVAKILLPVAMGLSHLHEVGIAHRDLKLANVVLDAAGTAKIADFGLATQETLCVDSVGTKFGMAPEQYAAKYSSPYNPKKADIWAIGIAFWQLKFWNLPWAKADYMAEGAFQRYVDNPAAFLLLTPRMGYGSASFLSQTLCLDPARRISADQVVRALQAMIELC
ncbi:hypothetical protein DFQ26_008728, partial [Actinomortierella ambigua]